MSSLAALMRLMSLEARVQQLELELFEERNLAYQIESSYKHLFTQQEMRFRRVLNATTKMLKEKEHGNTPIVLCSKPQVRRAMASIGILRADPSVVEAFVGQDERQSVLALTRAARIAQATNSITIKMWHLELARSIAADVKRPRLSEWSATSSEPQTRRC